MTEKMTMPGDELATSEEYMPGPGTYEREGKVFAAVMGKCVFNQNDRIVSVIEVKRTSPLKPGDVILGEVINVTNTMANVMISAVEPDPGYRISGETGVIHISKVTEAYTDDVRKEYRIGDLVRARVQQSAPSIQLSTREPNLGVLKARCGRCRAVLYNKAGNLYCPECDRAEQRKTADDFARYSPEYRG